jgi:hypothetical protein
MTTRFGSIVDDNYYVAVDPDGNEISRGSKKDKRYTDILAHSQDGSVVGTYRIIQPEVKVGLIAASPGVQPPNNAPEWISTPNPTWQDGVGGTYELSNDTFDPEGDTLTYAHDATSTALPANVTVSGSQLVATGSVVEGTTSGVRITVDDGIATAVASSNFDIVVSEASPVTSPTLWQDYGGNDFAGEAGALAVNDNWASTVYDYEPRYAPGNGISPAIPTIPTYSGAGYQSIVTTVSEMNAAIVAANAGTVTEIYVQRGSNLYTGTGSHTTISRIFTSGTPLWIMAYDSVTSGNNGEALRTYAPWDANFADRAVCGQFSVSNSEYIYFVGLSWGQYGVEANDMITSFDVDYLTFYRCHVEGWGGGWENTNANNPTLDPPPFPKLIANGGTLKSATVGGCFTYGYSAGIGNNAMVYQCNFERSIPTNGGEVKCIDFGKGDENKIVSCSFIDSGTVVQIGLSGQTRGVVVEDCDCHKTKFYNIDGIENPNGIYGANEGYVGFKSFNVTDTAVAQHAGRFYGNRFSGSRPTCPAFDTTATSAANYFLDSAGTAAGNGLFPKHRRDFRWNIFEDSHRMPFILTFGDNEGLNKRDSIVRNINYNAAGNSNGNSGFAYTNGGCEMALNTDYNNQALTFSMSFWNAANPTRDIQYTEIVGNLFMDILSPISSEAYLAGSGNCNVGYNVWADVNQSYTLNWPVGTETTQAGLGTMGDFTYVRFKLTNPTNRTIPDIVPTTSSIAGLRTIVPTTGILGVNANVGIDDVF